MLLRTLGSRLLLLVWVDVAPLRNREFRLLWTGQFVTLLGSQITAVAVPYQVYRLTGSPFAVGLLGLAELGPVLGLAFLGGALADARDRRALALATEVASIAVSLVLLVNALVPEPALWLLYAAASAQGGLYALQRPALEAVLPRIIHRDDLSSAGALTELRGTGAMLLGPAVGGLLISAVGLASTYAADAASYAISVVMLFLMRPVPAPTGADRPSVRRVGEGLAYARSRQDLLGTYLVDVVAMFFGMPAALFPAIADALGGPAVLGLLYTAPAFGAFLATSTSGWVRRVHRHGLAVFLAATTWGVAIALFGFADTLWPALALLAVAGAADAVSGIFRSTMWNQTIPDDLRGRLASIEMLSYTTGPSLGNLESGAVASLFSVRASVASGGVLCVLGCALCAALLPDLLRYDARRFRLKMDA